MITKFKEFMKLDESDGGCAMATNSGGGMGAVASPTVGSGVGAVWGEGSGTDGSGDLANGRFPVQEKQPLGTRRRRKKIQK